jgi:plasmid stabilization system protein ParE
VRVIWSPAALGDVGRIYDYIVSFNPGAAERLLRRLIEKGKSASAFRLLRD